jgi:hypothetical protein
MTVVGGGGDVKMVEMKWKESGKFRNCLRLDASLVMIVTNIRGRIISLFKT